MEIVPLFSKKMALFLTHLLEYRKADDKCKKNHKKACKTRWLSFVASIQAVWEDYIPVVQTLNAISETDATAYRL